MAIERSRKQAEELKNKVLRRFVASRDFRAGFDKKWSEMFRMYRCIIDEKAKRTKNRRATLYVPESWSQVETIAPRMVASVFASRPYVSVLARDLGTKGEAAQAMEYLLDYQLSDRIDIRAKAGTWLRDTVVYGHGPAKVSWRLQKRQRKVKLPFLENPLYKQVFDVFGVSIEDIPKEIEVTEYDDPWIEPIDVFNFFWAPDALNMEDARYVLQRQRVTMDYIEQQAELGIFEGTKKIKPRGYEDQESGIVARLGDLGLDEIDADTEEPTLELLEYWEDGLVVVVIDRTTVVRAEDNPFAHGRKPFVTAKVIPSSSQLPGISVLEAAESGQLQLNDWRNIRMDNTILKLYAPWFKELGVDIDHEDMVLGPGEIVTVPGRDAMWQHDVPDVRQSAYEEEKLLQDDIQKATGAYEVMRGQSMGSRTTATEVAVRSEQGGFRFEDMRGNIEHYGLLPAVQMMGSMNQQYIDTERAVRVAGPGGQELTAVAPHELVGDFDYMYMGSATEPVANRDLRRQQWLQLMQVVAQNPAVNQAKMLRTLFQLFDVRQPDAYIQQPPSMPMPGMGGEQPGGVVPGVGVPQPPAPGGGELLE